MSERAAGGKKAYIAAVKLLAIALVIFNHTKEKGYTLFTVTADSPLFALYLFASIACKVAVPLFFMCSGALLLGRDEPLSRLFRHRILRYVAVLLVISLVDYVVIFRSELGSFDLKILLARIYSDKVQVHLWFLYAYLACLLLLPFLRKLARALDGRDVAYMTALMVVFTGVIPAAEYLFGRWSLRLNSYLQPQQILISAFYMLAGYWMDAKMDLSLIRRKHLAAGAAAAVAAVALGCLMTVFKRGADGGYDPSLSQAFHNSFVTIPTLVLFALLRCAFERFKPSEAAARTLLYLGDLTFGIYLLHVNVFKLTRHADMWLRPKLMPLTATVVWILTTAVVSGAITALLKRIPGVRKFL